MLLLFTIYMPFSAASWQWLGNFGGESCWCAFTPGVPDEKPEPTGTDDQPALTSGDEDEDEEEVDETEGQEIDEDELDPDNEVAQDSTNDVVLEDALHVFESHGKVSAIELQRVLSISYVNAAHVIDRMEGKGMVSIPDVNGVRSLVATGKAPTKSGPADLAAYHEKVLDGGAVKRGRGRPRKTPVDPLTVDAATAF